MRGIEIMCRRKAMYIWTVIQDNAIIYNDNYLIVVNKPHGLQCEPDKNGHPDLLTEIRKYLNRINKPSKVLQPVNRLDRPVGGLMLFAKTAMALRTLNLMQEDRLIKKTYTALVEGSIEPKQGSLKHFHYKDLMAKRAIISNEPDKETKPCHLDYSVQSINDGNSLVEIQLHTGRYHQIRAQFSFVGHPIVGDGYYGSQKPFVENGIGLHASKLSFLHPITKEAISLECPFVF